MPPPRGAEPGADAGAVGGGKRVPEFGAGELEGDGHEAHLDVVLVVVGVGAPVFGGIGIGA